MRSLYDTFMKPLEKRGIHHARKTLMKKAKGHVLEIGSGTGANISHYDFSHIQSLTISDKSLSKHIKAYEDSHDITLIEADATKLPFDDNSFDTIVHTLVFCSVSDVNQGMQEMKRVLKPGGTLIFIEHVLPTKKGMKRLFKIINPVWRTVASGCNLTRSYEDTLVTSGFEISQVNRFMNTVFISGMAKVKNHLK